jgi:predicted aspartyl protease
VIRGYFGGPPGRRRPYIVGRVTVAQVTASVDVHFLVDTGADVTLLAPRDAAALRLDFRSFPRSRSTGIGGTTDTAIVPADITLLGRDVLGQFGLYVDERRDLVLLLETVEADALNLA